MDVDRDISQYWEGIDRQKRILQRAKSRQGQRPRDRKPREQLYLEFMMATLAVTVEEQRNEKHIIHSSFIPPAYLPCTTALAQLKPITINELRLETHHRDKYLLLRAITPPNRMTGILVLAEDEQDDAVALQLYQQEEEEIRKATDIIDVGAIVLIKEPFFKVMASGEYGLRVDHLSDIMRVDKDDPLLPNKWYPKISEAEESAELSKSKGDSAVGEGDYWKAIEEYSKALSQKATPDRTEIIKRNRALAYLKTKQFDGALLDTGFPNFGPNPSEKALFRAAEALYFLQRFEECQHVLQTLCASFPNNPQALAVSARARRRCLEASSGEYDFKLLQREAKKLQPPHLDHASYIGPIEVRETAKKGRGLFMTETVKAGDLLLCEKAFAHAYVPKASDSSSKVTLLINPEKGRGFMGGQADLIKIIVQKLDRNPSLAPAFITLHHGDYKPTSTLTVDGKPVIDTFLVEQIMSLNVFGCPLSSQLTHRDTEANHSEKSTAYHSCGIWTQASYINHSCTSNARRSFIGDMMAVRATQDLEPGTEITFWYQMPDDEPKKMQEKLKSWGFSCACAICQDDKETRPAVLAQRRKLLDELKRTCQQPAQTNLRTIKVERLLEALNNTYSRPMDQVPRILLWDPQLMLAFLYMEQKKVHKALESVQKVLALLGFTVVGADSTPTAFEVVKWGLLVDPLIELFLLARRAFEVMEALNDAKTAEMYAKMAYRIIIGEDTSFESTYGRREN